MREVASSHGARAARMSLFPGEPPLQHTGHVALSLGFGAGFSWEMSMITLWSFDAAVTRASTVPTSLVVLSDTPHLLGKHRRSEERRAMRRVAEGRGDRVNSWAAAARVSERAGRD